MTPLVSIVTPVHQAQRTLPDTAASLRAQTCADWEWLLVVDDNNAAQYRAMPGMDDARIRWFDTPAPRSGPSAARNIGLSAARGAFVTHLDADDLMKPERLACLLPLARQHGMATDLQEVFLDASGEVTGSCLPATTPQRVTLQDALAFDLPFFPLYRRSLDMRWHEEIRFSEDVLFNLELLARNGSMAVCPARLLRYRVHGNSISNAMPQGYLRARESYALILSELRSGLLAAHDESLKQTLETMFERKAALNERFWQAWQAGLCTSFAEFSSRQAQSRP